MIVAARTRRGARGPSTLEPYGAPLVPLRRPPDGQGGTRERRQPLPTAARRDTAIPIHLVSVNTVTLSQSLFNKIRLSQLCNLLKYIRCGSMLGCFNVNCEAAQRVRVHCVCIGRENSSTAQRRQALFVFHMSKYKYYTRKLAGDIRHACIFY